VTAPTLGVTGQISILRRLIAMTYEAFLVFGVLVVVFIFPHVVVGAALHRVASPPILWTHLFLVLTVYFSWFWCRSGQTLAMKTWRIKISDQSGYPVRPAQAVLRCLLCWPSIGLAGIGIAWALIDRDRQFLHDRLAGTRLFIA